MTTDERKMAEASPEAYRAMQEFSAAAELISETVAFADHEELTRAIRRLAEEEDR